MSLPSGWDRLRELTYGDLQVLALLGLGAIGLLLTYIGLFGLSLSVLRAMVR